MTEGPAHVFHTIADHRGNYDEADTCVQCKTGIKRCKLCGQFKDGPITTHCPRRRLLETEELRIVERDLDFIGATWVPSQRTYEKRYP